MANRYSTSYRMNRVLRDDRAALIVPIDHGLVWAGCRRSRRLSR